MGFLKDMVTKPDRDRQSFGPFWIDVKDQPGPKPMRFAISNLTSAKWELCLMPLESYAELAEQISDLAHHSVENNVFFEPEFALAGLQRLELEGVMLLCLWETVSARRMLRVFMPIINQRAGIPQRRFTRCFTHHFAPLGTPLLHRENAGESVETLLRMLADPVLKLSSVLCLDQQRTAGETIQLFERAARTLGLPTAYLSRHRRGVLAPADNQLTGVSYLRQAMTPKRHREYRRLLRRLKGTGDVCFEVVNTQRAVLDAFETFLTIEASGWKGRSGTALSSHKQLAAFSRQAISSLAEIKRCEIHTMSFNKQMIAALVCFKSGDELFAWKMAFDEEFKHYSPGVQLLMHASEHWLDLSDIRLVDSLATANHPLINRVWRERQPMGDMLIGTSSAKKNEVNQVVRSLERFQYAKRSVKNLLHRVGLR